MHNTHERLSARLAAGEKITAALLRGLEETTMLAARIFDEIEGLIQFRLDGSISAVPTENHTLAVTVGDLRGATAAGHSILLRRDERLTANLPIGAADEIAFSAAIEPNPEDPTDSGQGIRKYRLQLQRTDRGPIVESFSERLLDLGTYRWRRDARLELIRRPPLAALAAIEPVEETWTAPLEETLVRVRDHFEDRGPAGRRIADAADQLLAQWPILALPVLARQVILLRHRLRPELPRDQRLEELKRPFGAARPFADDLPAALAERIDHPAPHQVGPRPLVKEYDYRIIEKSHHSVRCQTLRPVPAGTMIARLAATGTTSPALCLRVDDCLGSHPGCREGQSDVYPFATGRFAAGEMFHFESIGEIDASTLELSILASGT